MKTKKMIIVLLLLFSLALAACGSGEEAETAARAGVPEVSGEVLSTSSAESALDEREGLQVQQLLAVATILLDETDTPITASQAQEQLVLWKTLSSLLQADNVTADEINAIYRQVESGFSAEQIASINSMELSIESIGLAFPNLQIPEGAGGFGSLTEEQLEELREQFESGDFEGAEGFTLPEGFTPPDGFNFEGGFPGGGGGPGGFGGGGGGQGGGQGAGEAGAEGRQGGGFARFGTQLVEEVIAFLEVRATN